MAGKYTTLQNPREVGLVTVLTSPWPPVEHSAPLNIKNERIPHI